MATWLRLLVALVCVTTCLARRKKLQKFNILHIGTDQQRTSSIGAYKNSFAHSPNLDKLASEGVLFENAHTVVPSCSPSRTSVLLGVHSPIHGVYENGISPHDHRDSLTPYFDVLKKQGYVTAQIGKTHFNPVPKSIDYVDAHTGNSDKRGPSIKASKFLETYLVNQSMIWIRNVLEGKFHKKKCHCKKCDCHWANARSCAKDDGSCCRQCCCENIAKPTPPKKTVVPGVDSKPWYLYLSMVSPHPPNWVPRGPWSSVYDDVQLPPLNYQNTDIADLPYQTRMLVGLLGHEHNHPKAFPHAEANMAYIDSPVVFDTKWPHGRKMYYAQCAYVDYEVGRMMKFLDKYKLRRNTLVIFVSDHGTELYDHGINNDKHNFLDATLRVPLIMRLPGVLPANERRNFATTLDVTATILAAAGAKTPRDYQGFDLLTPISKGLPSPRKAAVSSCYRAMAVTTPTWKLSYFPERDEGRLFHRILDPYEQVNLFNITQVSVKIREQHTQAQAPTTVMPGFDPFHPSGGDPVVVHGRRRTKLRGDITTGDMDGDGVVDAVEFEVERDAMGFDSPSALTKLKQVRDGLLLALLRWRSQQDALGYMQRHSKKGAQTATLAWAHTESITGLDAEIRLQNDVLRFEGIL